MGREYEGIDARLEGFLCRQPVFFVATAPLAGDGHVNVSPKGLISTFGVIDPRRVAYLDLTGSGVETIAHLRENGRITLMFCAFDGPPRVVRLAGRGRVVLPAAAGFGALVARFAPIEGIRAVVDINVDRISDSCGYGVPRMTLVHDRDDLERWAERKGPQGLEIYHRTKNAVSIDGLPGLGS